MQNTTWWRELIARIAEVPDDDFDERTEELSEMLELAFAMQSQGLVRDTKAAMQSTRVEITPVSLGDWTGKRYSCFLPLQQVRHYCLSSGGSQVLVTATEFQGSESSSGTVEQALATLRIDPNG